RAEPTIFGAFARTPAADTMQLLGRPASILARRPASLGLRLIVAERLLDVLDEAEIGDAIERQHGLLLSRIDAELLHVLDVSLGERKRRVQQLVLDQVVERGLAVLP